MSGGGGCCCPASGANRAMHTTRIGVSRLQCIMAGRSYAVRRLRAQRRDHFRVSLNCGVFEPLRLHGRTGRDEHLDDLVIAILGALRLVTPGMQSPAQRRPTVRIVYRVERRAPIQQQPHRAHVPAERCPVQSGVAVIARSFVATSMPRSSRNSTTSVRPNSHAHVNPSRICASVAAGFIVPSVLKNVLTISRRPTPDADSRSSAAPRSARCFAASPRPFA